MLWQLVMSHGLGVLDIVFSLIDVSEMERELLGTHKINITCLPF